MATDLSEKHQPLTDLFPAGVTDDRQWMLRADQIQFFEENGYLSGVRMLDDRQVEALREELEQFLTPGHEGSEYWYEYHSNESADPDRVLFHALGAWRIGEAFHDLLWDPAFTVPATQLLGGPVRFWHDQLFCKPAKHGGVVAWHQDYSYWTRTKPMAHLTCWIALDHSTRENGCVQYVPGSHRWPLLPMPDLAGDMDSIRDVLSQSQWEQFQHPVCVELRPGEATFHHPLMVHGSRENSTDTPRRATVINVLRDGVRSDSNEPLLQGVPVIEEGELVAGRFFPLLSSDSSQPLTN